jgi:hypothetical protein
MEAVSLSMGFTVQREHYPKSYEDWYIILFQCQNCGLEGEGRIDAQGTLWVFGG